MDKIIYDNKLGDAIKMWLGIADYIELDHYPFNEVEIEVNDGEKKSNINIVFKGDKLITTVDKFRQVNNVELKDGKIHVIKTSYSDFKNKKTIDELAKVAVGTINPIFSFVANYNLPQNSKARSIFAMRDLMYGNFAISKVNKTKGSDFKKNSSKKIKTNSSKLLNLVETAKYYGKIEIEEEKREYNRTCPAWTVKGFYRKLKNGDSIWIEPFVKGKNKDEIQDKIYKF